VESNKKSNEHGSNNIKQVFANESSESAFLASNLI